MTRVLVVMTALALGSSACVSGSGFVCELDEQCQGASPGQCESTGFCSFADPSCDSGRRYGEAAGNLSARCTDLGGPDAADQPDASPGTPDAPVGEPDAAPNPPDATPMDDAGPIIVDFVPTNIPSSTLASGTNALTLQTGDGEVEINADTGAITRLSDFADLHPLGVGFTRINQPGSHPDVGVLSMTGLTIEAGVTVRVVGSAALAIAIKGNATIAGTIDVSGGRGANDGAGPGGHRGGASSDCDGSGDGGGHGGQTGSDVGGGGGGYLSAGGAGGGRGSNNGGNAGNAYGAVLIPLVGGSGGGCGGGSSPRARGGGGGGALQISARGIVHVTAAGIVDASGSGGSGGSNDNGGGGGGAGGGLVIEAGRIILSGTVVANGGGGGAGADKEQPGASGQRGARNTARAPGGPNAGEGEAGGAGGAGANGDGMSGTSAAGTGLSDNAGGGGGAAGRIRLRSDDIQRPGTVSPLAGLTEAAL